MPTDITQHSPLVHGGQLTSMAEKYARPVEQWLDLSTGIAPVSYPIPAIPQHIWQRLPEPSQALLKAARDYYQTDNLLPISGSQAIIQRLPQIVRQKGYQNSRIWLPQVGYQEHHKAWKNMTDKVHFYQDILHITPQQQDIVLLINPNNPTGTHYAYQQVAELFAQIEQHKGLLIIDEAFMDCTPQQSFIQHSQSQQLIVLRSIGKFFGLAGLRLGFVAASPSWLRLFADDIGPWSINGPAQFVVQQALVDKTWQTQQREFLHNQSLELATLLQLTFKRPAKGTGLFQTIHCHHAEAVFEQLCQLGVYVRLCDEKDALRFGIPLADDMPRLQTALQAVFKNRF